eukprot:UC4_evm1s881
MIRLSTAVAKSRLSNEVNKEDAKYAMELINFAYYNEAKPLDKPDSRAHEDEDDDDDNSEDDDDDMNN